MQTDHLGRNRAVGVDPDLFALSPNIGAPGVQAFVIIVLGRMGSVGGSVIGGILLGIV